MKRRASSGTRRAQRDLAVEIVNLETGPEVAIWRQTIEVLCRWALEKYFEEHPDVKKGLSER